MNALEAADALWRGEAQVAGPPALDGSMEEGINPFVPRGELVEIDEGTAFVSAFANVSAFETADGLVCVDSGTAFAAPDILRMLRGWSQARVHTTVFSHGHLDHVEGIAAFESEAAERGCEPPRVVAHEGVLDRFARYALTPGYNSAINARQFGAEVPWPTDYRQPDETYRDRMEFEVGGERFELRHARGETDDATWIWVPGRKVLCSGDLIIWCVPNAGNPQKVQRYAREWAAALREMSQLGAEALLPGHGLPVVGADRVEAILTDTAALLEHLHERTVELMNEGRSLGEILERVEAPPELLEKPYLRPIYDDPEFVRPQRLAPVRRLVRPRPREPEAGAGFRAGRRAGPPGGRLERSRRSRARAGRRWRPAGRRASGRARPRRRSGRPRRARRPGGGQRAPRDGGEHR